MDSFYIEIYDNILDDNEMYIKKIIDNYGVDLFFCATIEIETLFIELVKYDRAEMIVYLIDNCYKVIPTEQFFYCLSYVDEYILEYILDKFPLLTFVIDENGDNCLSYADKIGIFEILYYRGAYINNINKKGETILMILLENKKITEFILKQDINIFIKNNLGYTAKNLSNILELEKITKQIVDKEISCKMDCIYTEIYDNNNIYTKCYICYEEYNVGDNILFFHQKVLGHNLHKKCFDKLVNKQNCPYCRQCISFTENYEYKEKSKLPCEYVKKASQLLNIPLENEIIYTDKMLRDLIHSNIASLFL